MRKRKTHAAKPYPNYTWSECGRLGVLGVQFVGRRPTCLTCKRALAARKGK